MNSWFVLHRVRSFMALDTILSCLGKKGYEIPDEWVSDTATKQDWQAFLCHFESTLDTRVGPRVRVYDLEAIHKNRDETAHELVAHIQQMASWAHIGDGSVAAIEFEVQCRFIKAITDDEIELQCRLLAAPLTTTTNEVFTIAENYYAVEHWVHLMSSSWRSVNAVQASNTHHLKGQHKPQHQKKQNTSTCGNCTKQHAPSRANCPAGESECNKCGHISHWWSGCCGGAPQTKKGGKPKHFGKRKREKGHTDLVELDEYDGQYDEIDLHSVNLTDPNDDSGEIKINNIIEPQKTEAYTIIHLPADCKENTDASVRVKVNTGAGGNVMPLRIFEQLYTRKINYKGKPIGFETSTTHLTAYNGTPILQYGTLRCPLTWRPGNGEKARRIQSKWYVADTPGPATLGLPSCKRLKVITLNSSVRITHMTPVSLDKRDHANNGMDQHVGTIP